MEQKFKEDLEQVSVRETNESEPFEDASLRIQTSSKPEAKGASGIKSVGCLMTGQTATGVEGA